MKRKGFTLIELIIVIIILAIVGFFVVFTLSNIGLLGSPTEVEITVIDKSSPIDGDGNRRFFVNTQLPDGTKMDYLAREKVFYIIKIGEKYTVVVVGNCITGTK